MDEHSREGDEAGGEEIKQRLVANGEQEREGVMCPACMATGALLITSAGGITVLAVKVRRLKEDLKAARSKKAVRFRTVTRVPFVPQNEQAGEAGAQAR